MKKNEKKIIYYIIIIMYKQKFMKYFKKQNIMSGGNPPSNIQCPFCLKTAQELKNMNILNNEFIRLECGHIVHKLCWEDWSREHNSCPQCRKFVDNSKNIILSKEVFPELYDEAYVFTDEDNKRIEEKLRSLGYKIEVIDENKEQINKYKAEIASSEREIENIKNQIQQINNRIEQILNLDEQTEQNQIEIQQLFYQISSLQKNQQELEIKIQNLKSSILDLQQVVELGTAAAFAVSQSQSQPKSQQDQMIYNLTIRLIDLRNELNEVFNNSDELRSVDEILIEIDIVKQQLEQLEQLEQLK